MRELTTNRRILKVNNSKIQYTVEKQDGKFVFTSLTPHNFNSSSKVILKKEFNENEYQTRLEQRLYTITTQKELPVSVIDSHRFTIDFDEYVLVDVVNYAAEDKDSVLEFLNINPYEFVNNEYEFEIKSFGKTYKGKIGLSFDEESKTYTNEEDAIAGYVVFDEIIPHIKEEGTVHLRNTWHFKNGTEEFDYENISIYESGYFLSSFIGISETTSYKVGDDNLIGEKFLKEVAETITPEIIDNEKRQFVPAMTKGNTFKLAQELEFNLHFRSRIDLDKSTDKEAKLTDTWKTTDEQIWNCHQWKDDVPESGLEYINENYNDDLADELNHLGFTEDDIKYQKTKLKKTFIRLLFYSSKNMLDKELLYYSTIFLDTGELYTKYSNIKNSYGDKVFSMDRTDNNFRLSARFSVKNKYDATKSSEGFYLYLFPNEVTKENEAKTIYMKVEFNHAGYGKTIPMMLPRDNEGGYNVTNFVVESTSEKFPSSFLVKEQINEETEGITMDIERYTDSIMIPINIIYDKTLKSYLYYCPWYNRGNENKIVFNLWEPRVRGGINGDN